MGQRDEGDMGGSNMDRVLQFSQAEEGQVSRQLKPTEVWKLSVLTFSVVSNLYL